MTEELHSMLAYILEKEAGFGKSKARSIASYFSDYDDFINCSEWGLKSLKGVGGKKPIKLSGEEIQRIIETRKSGFIDTEKTPRDNLISAMGRGFTKRQVDMIRNLMLDKLNSNPFLITTLNLKTPEEVVRVNVYQAATRSIVTSMGFLVEKLLEISGDDVESANGTGWDLKKVSNGETAWIQVKSGPNDMDKDQIIYWAEKIREKLVINEKGYIGITYGKRDSTTTVSLNLMRQHIPEWVQRTLIGRELWDYISDDPEYHNKLMEIFRESAIQVMTGHSICEEVEICIQRLTNDFIEKYGDGVEGVSKYIDSLW